MYKIPYYVLRVSARETLREEMRCRRLLRRHLLEEEIFRSVNSMALPKSDRWEKPGSDGLGLST